MKGENRRDIEVLCRHGPVRYSLAIDIEVQRSRHGNREYVCVLIEDDIVHLGRSGGDGDVSDAAAGKLCRSIWDDLRDPVGWVIPTVIDRVTAPKRVLSVEGAERSQCGYHAGAGEEASGPMFHPAVLPSCSPRLQAKKVERVGRRLLGK